jgi:hypothetical protein
MSYFFSLAAGCGVAGFYVHSEVVVFNGRKSQDIRYPERRS